MVMYVNYITVTFPDTVYTLQNKKSTETYNEITKHFTDILLGRSNMKVKLTAATTAKRVSDTNRLLKGAASQCPSVLAVDAVSRDGHQMSLGRHDVTQQRQVAVVDVGAVERDHVEHLALNRLPHGLNAQTLMRQSKRSDNDCFPEIMSS